MEKTFQNEMEPTRFEGYVVPLVSWNEGMKKNMETTRMGYIS